MTKTNTWLLILVAFCLSLSSLRAQEGATITGNLETNANVFLKDSLIGAIGQPQYDNQFFGGEIWLNLNYRYKDLAVGVRYDMYNNSNLRTPNGSYTDQGLGRWFVQKSFDKLSFEIGNLYDQIGSGIIYRAYEQRPLFIDNSLLGGSVKYDITDDMSIRAFVGRQKNAFDLYGGNIKGMAFNSFFAFGEENPVTISPGVGFINKTLSDQSVDQVANVLRNYTNKDRFDITYNSYAATFFNTMGYKNFSWYVETAYKSNDIYFNPFALKEELQGEPTQGKLTTAPGSVIYSSISYAKGKLGITLEGKRTENFSFRIDPSARLLRGLVSFIPPMNRQNTYRLTARYSPATQEVSEKAFQADVRYRFNKKWSVNVNASNVQTLDDTLLYNEVYTEVNYKHSRKLKITGGVQVLDYNQSIYEQKPNVPMVQTVTPYVDILYKFSRKKSLRFEAQYMNTAQDFGSWIFAQAELGLAPHWIFELSGMYNVDPSVRNGVRGDKILYPVVGVVYVHKSNRMQLKYVKQVEGVVCSGGICRLEPAFSGVRFSMTSNF